MTIRSREEAAAASLLRTTNPVGACQLVTRLYYDAPSAGDRDHDGDADAVDGWVSEPLAARHPGDRKPPRGTPVRWSGGSHGFGHSAESLGPDAHGVYQIRTTDAPRSGITSTQSLDYIERVWGLHYLGWSETIDGYPIPYKVPVEPVKPGAPKGEKVVVPKSHREVPRAIRLTERAAIRAEALGQKARAKSLRVALKALRLSTTQKKTK